jgi:DNA-binding transcriptional MerR regulator
MAIGALARRTGVPVDTLRAWERRYGVLRPERTEGGQRRYGPADVERVLWLAARVAEGQRISDAAAALEAIEAARAEPGSGPSRTLSGALADAARRGEVAGIEAELDRAFAALPLVQALELAVFPAMVELGERWADGEEIIAAEHLLSEAAGRRLAARLSAARRARGPFALICCPEGERHALGAMALAVLMATDGWRVAYLGADTPLDQAHVLATRRGARVGVAVCTLPGSGARTAERIRALPDPSMWVLAGPDARTGLGPRCWGPSLEQARTQAGALIGPGER